MIDQNKCFGFYTGEWICKQDGCKAVAQCKALVNSDGLDVAADTVDHLLDDMSQSMATVPSTDSVKAMVAFMLNPESAKAALERLRRSTPQKFPQLEDPL